MIIKKLQKGFTLVELLVVISIIGILASMVLISLGVARAKARDVKRLTDLRAMKGALEFYYDANNTYPPETCLPQNGADGWAGNYQGYETCWADLQTKLAPYLSKLPTDPVGVTVYLYGSYKGGQGFTIVMTLEKSNAKGDACFFPEQGYYCVGSNWQ